MSKQSKQTGPITPMGKIKSSQNARKSNLFTKGYLETEDIEAKKIEFEALCQQWGAQDNPTMLKILSTIEQASLGMDRLRIAEKHKIEGRMQSSSIQQLFGKEAGLNLITASQLPYWFFLEVDCDEKKLALAQGKRLAEIAIKLAK